MISLASMFLEANILPTPSNSPVAPRNMYVTDQLERLRTVFKRGGMSATEYNQQRKAYLGAVQKNTDSPESKRTGMYV